MPLAQDPKRLEKAKGELPQYYLDAVEVVCNEREPRFRGIPFDELEKWNVLQAKIARDPGLLQQQVNNPADPTPKEKLTNLLKAKAKEKYGLTGRNPGHLQQEAALLTSLGQDQHQSLPEARLQFANLYAQFVGNAGAAPPVAGTAAPSNQLVKETIELAVAATKAKTEEYAPDDDAMTHYIQALRGAQDVAEFIRAETAEQAQANLKQNNAKLQELRNEIQAVANDAEYNAKLEIFKQKYQVYLDELKAASLKQQDELKVRMLASQELQTAVKAKLVAKKTANRNENQAAADLVREVFNDYRPIRENNKEKDFEAEFKKAQEVHQSYIKENQKIATWNDVDPTRANSKDLVLARDIKKLPNLKEFAFVYRAFGEDIVVTLRNGTYSVTADLNSPSITGKLFGKLTGAFSKKTAEREILENSGLPNPKLAGLINFINNIDKVLLQEEGKSSSPLTLSGNPAYAEVTTQALTALKVDMVNKAPVDPSNQQYEMVYASTFAQVNALSDQKVYDEFEAEYRAKHSPEAKTAAAEGQKKAVDKSKIDSFEAALTQFNTAYGPSEQAKTFKKLEVTLIQMHSRLNNQTATQDYLERAQASTQDLRQQLQASLGAMNTEILRLKAVLEGTPEVRDAQGAVTQAAVPGLNPLLTNRRAVAIREQLAKAQAAHAQFEKRLAFDEQSAEVMNLRSKLRGLNLDRAELAVIRQACAQQEEIYARAAAAAAPARGGLAVVDARLEAARDAAERDLAQVRLRYHTARRALRHELAAIGVGYPNGIFTELNAAITRTHADFDESIRNNIRGRVNKIKATIAAADEQFRGIVHDLRTEERRTAVALPGLVANEDFHDDYRQPFLYPAVPAPVIHHRPPARAKVAPAVGDAAPVGAPQASVNPFSAVGTYLSRWLSSAPKVAPDAPAPVVPAAKGDFDAQAEQGFGTKINQGVIQPFFGLVSQMWSVVSGDVRRGNRYVQLDDGQNGQEMENAAPKAAPKAAAQPALVPAPAPEAPVGDEFNPVNPAPKSGP